jgi:hypothetical protein
MGAARRGTFEIGTTPLRARRPLTPKVVEISGLGSANDTDTPSGGDTCHYVVTSYYSGNGANCVGRASV